MSTSENEKLTKDQSNEYYVFEEPDDNGKGIYYYVRQGAKVIIISPKKTARTSSLCTMARKFSTSFQVPNFLVTHSSS